MKIAKLAFAIAMSGLFLCCSFNVVAAQESTAQMEMPKPTEQHLWLKKFEGEWTSEMKCQMGPDLPPMESEGKMKAEMLGDFWLVNEMSGEMAGDMMKGLQHIGFDADKGKYVGTWIDNSNAMMWHYVGEVDKSGKKLTLEADGPNFITGEGTTKFRDAYEFKSDDVLIMTSSLQNSDGSWITFMEGELKRVK